MMKGQLKSLSDDKVVRCLAHRDVLSMYPNRSGTCEDGRSFRSAHPEFRPPGRAAHNLWEMGKRGVARNMITEAGGCSPMGLVNMQGI
jgi:hypothetical protein